MFKNNLLTSDRNKKLDAYVPKKLLDGCGIKIKDNKVIYLHICIIDTTTKPQETRLSFIIL